MALIEHDGSLWDVNLSMEVEGRTQAVPVVVDTNMPEKAMLLVQEAGIRPYCHPKPYQACPPGMHAHIHPAALPGIGERTI